MGHLVCLLLLLFGSAPASSVSLNETCPEGRACVPLSRCTTKCDILSGSSGDPRKVLVVVSLFYRITVFINILNQFQTLTLLRDAICGFPDPSSLEPLVCCSLASVSDGPACDLGQPASQEQCGLTKFTAADDDSMRVIGGVGATPGRWPWAAALAYRRKNKMRNQSLQILCSGNLISR